MPTAYENLARYARKTATLGSVASLVGWDQETYLPPKGTPFRAEQMEMLAGMLHERNTSPKLGELIDAAAGEVAGDDELSASVREFKRDYDKATKLPNELVAELAKVGSEAQEVWKDARERSDFATFAPWLERMIGLTRQKAECYGVPDGGELYDALLDEYEPGATAQEIEGVFTPLGKELAGLLAELREGQDPDDSLLNLNIPADRQHAFGQFVMKQLGFDMDAGRLDTTTHPFCSGLAPGDTRLTTRYRDERFTDALYGTMHECGHGLYDQGLRKHDRFGEPLADDAGLGTHESQSRMWENMVGRSRAFWEWALPHAKEMLGGGLEGATVEQMYRAVNTAKPSYIRVEADEPTYNAHVMIRFELERAMFKGELSVKDIPAAWNEKYRQYLGLDVPDDKRGCLQDVHWSFGLIGYFPTYTLGNLYAAQFWDAIGRDVPDRDGQIARGEFGAILSWTREHIHRHGRRYRAAELCERATGKALSAEPLLRYLGEKLRPIYSR